MLGHFKKRDIAGGDFLYGERIMLARILTEEGLSDTERTKRIIECLHDRKLSDRQAARLIDYGVEVATGLAEWLQREKDECTVTPLPEEQKADCRAFSSAVGDLGNVVALSDRFQKTFEEIYKLKYTDVFAIWKVDAETTKYRRRLRAVYDQQAKRK